MPRALLALLLLAAASAADALPEVPDPLGLGRRLALIDLLQTTYEVHVEPGATEADLDEIWRREIAKRAPPPPPPPPPPVPDKPAVAAAPAPPERDWAEDDTAPRRDLVPARESDRDDSQPSAPTRDDRPAAKPRAAVSRDTTLAVGDEGWAITFPDFGFRRPELRANGDGFATEASGDGVIVSVFVETPAGAGRTHRDVKEHYWPLAKRNPLIDAPSIVERAGDAFVTVTYTTAGIANANYYFCFRDRWVDVHVSIPSTTAGVFDAFASRLRYAAAAPKPPPTGAVIAGQRIGWTVPAGWRLVVTEVRAGKAVELRLTGPGVRLDGALVAAPADLDLRHAAEGACAPFLSGSVEGVPRLQAFGEAGWTATLTDSRLVGAKPTPGKWLLATGGAARVGGAVALFGILHQEAAAAKPALEFLRSLRAEAAGASSP